jgi:subtilisin-like proprotein convertase family protein
MQNRTVHLKVMATITVQSTPNLPLNGATSVSQTPQLTWGAVSGATTYDLQVSTSSTFGTTVINATGLTATSYTTGSPLTGATTYYWRTRAANACGVGPWSVVYDFSTICSNTVNSTNVPVNISGSGTPTVTSTLTVTGITGNMVSFKVKDLKIHHSWIGDIKATLTAPNSTSYVLLDRPGYVSSGFGCSENHILVTLDNAAALTSAQLEGTCNISTAATPPPYAINGTYQPVNSLAPLTGTSPNGTWTLTVQDLVNGDGGSIQAWGIEFTTICESNLNLTQTFVQGYMDGSTMRPVLLNSGVAGATATQADTITVALNGSAPPYSQVYAKKTVLNTNGSTSLTLPPSALGNSYYLVIKGRNLVETWSAAPIAFSSSTAYHFGAAGQAYGGNLGISSGIPVIYNGDINGNPFGDGSVDFIDYSIWENDYNNFLSGYYASDLNGDNSVDFLDYVIWEVNYNNFISTIKP